MRVEHKENIRGAQSKDFANRSVLKPIENCQDSQNVISKHKLISRGVNLPDMSNECRFSRAGIASIFAICFVALALASAAHALDLYKSQIRVVDGDTVRVDGESVRLVGFDTPETWKPKCAYEKALGVQATKRLEDLVARAFRVEMHFLPGRDKYDRLLGRFVLDGIDVRDTLVSEGLARRYNGGKRKGWC